MARDAAGAEWGRYFRDKRKLGPVDRLRNQKLPSVYLLSRVRADLRWFGEFQHEVKVGRTSRSPQLRADAFAADGYRLHAYWSWLEDDLERIEGIVIGEMRRVFNKPSAGREFFIVPNVDTAYWLIVDTLAASGVVWDSSQY